PEFLLFLFCLLSHLLGLGSSLLCLGSLLSQRLLLRDRFSLRLLSFFSLARSFLCRLLRLGLEPFCLGAGGLSLFLGFFGIGAALGFSVGIGAGFGCPLFGSQFVGRSFSLSFVFGALLHRHHARFFGRLSGLARSGFDCRLALLLPIRSFSLHQLL